nr:vacuole morphology and inheritance protein 14 [Quercus suber]
MVAKPKPAGKTKPENKHTDRPSSTKTHNYRPVSTEKHSSTDKPTPAAKTAKSPKPPRHLFPVNDKQYAWERSTETNPLATKLGYQDHKLVETQTGKTVGTFTDTRGSWPSRNTQFGDFTFHNEAVSKDQQTGTMMAMMGRRSVRRRAIKVGGAGRNRESARVPPSLHHSRMCPCYQSCSGVPRHLLDNQVAFATATVDRLDQQEPGGPDSTILTFALPISPSSADEYSRPSRLDFQVAPSCTTMDSAIAKALQDKLYDRRKAGALDPVASFIPPFFSYDLLEYLVHHSTSRHSTLYRTRLIEEAHRLETSVRNAYAEGNHDKIARIVHQLVHDYAYAIHQPHARNGGLIGLAAAAIALGPRRSVRRRAIKVGGARRNRESARVPPSLHHSRMCPCYQSCSGVPRHLLDNQVAFATATVDRLDQQEPGGPDSTILTFALPISPSSADEYSRPSRLDFQVAPSCTTMDSAIAKALQDKLYDRRKAGALDPVASFIPPFFSYDLLEYLVHHSTSRHSTLYRTRLIEEAHRLETSVRNAYAEGNHDKIARIVHQLVHDYAYAIHQPHARNGGLIGLAAAAIALGPDVARYMREIVPPVLACFSDQDARVRYYACESMYNIAKVAKGEVLVFFNDVFDALSKLAADTELSVKNGAELLDRLVKDIVSESAATYASMIQPDTIAAESEENTPTQSVDLLHAFSLPRFIPLLQERINVINPFARTFLVSWIVVLDSVPDLELVAYLPSFLGGLLRFLSDPNADVHTTTREALDRFLSEIKKYAAVQKSLMESKRSREAGRKNTDTSATKVGSPIEDGHDERVQQAEKEIKDDTRSTDESTQDAEAIIADGRSSVTVADDDEYESESESDNEWIPGQDVEIDYRKILEILITYLSESAEDEVQVTALRWIESFMDICPEDILYFTPRLLATLLPALSHDVDLVKEAASRVNNDLMAYIMNLPEEHPKSEPAVDQAPASMAAAPASTAVATGAIKTLTQTQNADIRRDGAPNSKVVRAPTTPDLPETAPRTPEVHTPEPPVEESSRSEQSVPTDLDYEAAVNSLTLQFLNEHEATRVAALAWLIMLHRKSPRKILAIQDATFPALLKTLSDPAEAVVTRDLLLLSQISKSSDDTYFTSFMVNLLKLFCTDRRLLETRGNLIIRQLCLTLLPERIYRTMADCLERDFEEDVEFASIMVQNLNNNLITAPELQDLRKRLRNLDSRDGQTFFTFLFRAWCVNAVATFSLCLLAQAYEQAYELLKVFAELEMTVEMLIQIDKLVQLLESPVFTYLRMQLLEPERYPHLYKCMYGVLMLLPQSSGFAALKNRLNSVSAIGYLHIAPRGAPATTPSSVSTFERQNRLKSRDAEGGIRWNELLEKFRTTQERVRRSQLRRQVGDRSDDDLDAPQQQQQQHPNENRSTGRHGAFPQKSAPHISIRAPAPAGVAVPGHAKGKTSLTNLGRFTGGGGGNTPKKDKKK